MSDFRDFPCRVVGFRFGYFPRRFLWRGRRVEVVSVERVWTCRAGVLRNRQMRCFSVQTSIGSCVLSHDLTLDLWSVRVLIPDLPPAVKNPVKGASYA